MAFIKKIKKAKKAARMASKGAIGAGKLATQLGATGVGSKLQAGGRAGRAATRGQGMKAAKHVGTLRR